MPTNLALDDDVDGADGLTLFQQLRPLVKHTGAGLLRDGSQVRRAQRSQDGKRPEVKQSLHLAHVQVFGAHFSLPRGSEQAERPVEHLPDEERCLLRAQLRDAALQAPKLELADVEDSQASKSLATLFDEGGEQ